MTLKFTIIDKASDLKPEALSFLIDLDTHHFPTPWGQESWDKVFHSIQERFILILEDRGAFQGFALFDISSADSFAHLLKIVVTPNVRGAGFGKALLNEAVRVLKEREIKKFFLEVEEHNASAIRLYQSEGFKIIHQKKQFYSSGATALIMTLDV